MSSSVDAARSGLDSVLGHFVDLTADQRSIVAQLHRLIVEVADEVEATPVVVETKWGQPSLRAARPGASTPLRIAVTDDGDVALLAHCQTSVMPGLQDRSGEAFRFDGNRGVLFATTEDLRSDLLRTAIAHALTYHHRPGPPSSSVHTPERTRS